MSRVLVICARRYNGHELWTLLKRLREHEHTFEVVSSSLNIKDELTFEPNILKRLVYDVPISEIPKWDGICVVSGNMADTEAYWTDDHILSLLQTAKDHKKVIAAICCSVPTLAPICDGVRVAPFPLVRSKHRLLKFGAILEPVSICADLTPTHRIITAENQMMSYMWGDIISKTLKDEEVPIEFKPTKYAENFKGRTPRRLPEDVEKVLSRYRPTPIQIKPRPGS